MQLTRIIDWMTFRDYDLDKKIAASRIVARQSRGSIAAQNGWYMNLERLLEQSRAADSDMAFLLSTISK
jgi:hypothetical protein